MKSVKNGLKELIEDIEDKEDVTFYPTYGYREGSDWKIPIRIWVHEPCEPAEELATLLAASIGKANDQEKKNLKARIADIVADSESGRIIFKSGEEVIFKFDNDPDEEKWEVQSKTDLNGIIEGFVKLPHERASTLLERQGSEKGWLTFRAISKEHSGIGRVRLIEREGLSVVSDIDDTIKITEIPAGGEVVVRNTFFRNFAAAPGMANRYRDLGEASFHYVSGGPWQLYAPLSDYMKENGFPEGSFHMKGIPTNPLSPKTWEDLFKLVGDATIVQKISQISEIMSRFPERKFILVGDSGEHDPEVYGQLRETFRDQIKEILIRDVVDARHTSPDRLDGMTIIEALTVVKGMSQFQ